jgi:hypothetical protein
MLVVLETRLCCVTSGAPAYLFARVWMNKTPIAPLMMLARVVRAATVACTLLKARRFCNITPVAVVRADCARHLFEALLQPTQSIAHAASLTRPFRLSRN